MDNDNDNEEDAVQQYQKTTKMFYHIVIVGLGQEIVNRHERVTLFARRIAVAYTTLCRITGSWREDEQYKADPRWKE